MCRRENDKMKKMLNTLYVVTPERYLSLDGENIVVQEDGREVSRTPLLNLEAVVTFGYTGASPAVMGACAKRGISLSFITAGGRFLASVMVKNRETFSCGNSSSGIRTTRLQVAELREI
jgi:CRISPR-associated protein Cas1